VLASDVGFQFLKSASERAEKKGVLCRIRVLLLFCIVFFTGYTHLGSPLCLLKRGCLSVDGMPIDSIRGFKISYLVILVTYGI
jgi:hypothetical protein